MERSTHPVDDFFRKALREHQTQPSEAAREQFLNEASAIQTRGRRRRYRLILAVSGLLLTGASAYLVWTASPREKNPEVISAENMIIHEPAASSLPEGGDPQPAVRGGRMPAGHGHSEEIRNFPEEPSGVSETFFTPEPVSPDPEAGIPDEEPAPGQSPDETRPDTSLPEPELPVSIEADRRTARSADWHFSVSASYSPEWMFNTLEGEKFVNNAGFESSVRYGRYSLRTGAGLSITTGTNELMVAYNDYLGSYNQLDSIQFHWDEQNYRLIPTYYLSMKDVWDSLLRTDYPRIIKRYTYLQIPLILGYDVIQKEWFSLGFRAGPIVSILMRSKQLSDNWDPGKNRVIRINQITPDRIQTNWQAMGGVNATFRISRRITIELEPAIRYYFNSVHEKSDITKKPWSVGFRTAVSILL